MRSSAPADQGAEAAILKRIMQETGELLGVAEAVWTYVSDTPPRRRRGVRRDAARAGCRGSVAETAAGEFSDKLRAAA